MGVGPSRADGGAAALGVHGRPRGLFPGPPRQPHPPLRRRPRRRRRRHRRRPRPLLLPRSRSGQRPPLPPRVRLRPPPPPPYPPIPFLPRGPQARLLLPLLSGPFGVPRLPSLCWDTLLPIPLEPPERALFMPQGWDCSPLPPSERASVSLGESLLCYYFMEAMC